jgi:hypothetical protein
MAITSLTRNSIQNPNKYTDLLAGNSVYEVSSLVPLGSYTATGGPFSITNVPQIYQDLVVVIQSRDTRTNSLWQFYFGFNDSAVAGQYTWTELSGNGSAASSTRSTGSNQFAISAIPGASATAGIWGGMVINILNYRSSTYKTMIYRSAYDLNGSGGTTVGAGLWSNTAAINRFDFRTEFLAGSTVTLYGVKAVGQ